MIRFLFVQSLSLQVLVDLIECVSIMSSMGDHVTSQSSSQLSWRCVHVLIADCWYQRNSSLNCVLTGPVWPESAVNTGSTPGHTMLSDNTTFTLINNPVRLSVETGMRQALAVVSTLGLAAIICTVAGLLHFLVQASPTFGKKTLNLVTVSLQPGMDFFHSEILVLIASKVLNIISRLRKDKPDILLKMYCWEYDNHILQKRHCHLQQFLINRIIFSCLSLSRCWICCWSMMIAWQRLFNKQGLD